MSYKNGDIELSAASGIQFIRSTDSQKLGKSNNLKVDIRTHNTILNSTCIVDKTTTPTHRDYRGQWYKQQQHNNTETIAYNAINNMYRRQRTSQHWNNIVQ